MRPFHIFQSWGKALIGKVPMLSIEITRECPLQCPGCYAYGDSHLGSGGPNLRSVSDHRGDELVRRVLEMVDEHEPLQLSLVGGEPLMRHRELTKLLPQLSDRGIYTLIVTSGVIPIPHDWICLPRVTVAVSVDGNPEDHDVRRKPATYERILGNIAERKVNIHWTVVRNNVEQAGYMDRYLAFWNAKPEVNRIWVSIYTPQIGEESAERLTSENRAQLASYFASVGKKYPKLTMHPGIMAAFVKPPAGPSDCVFSRISLNYTADLRTRVEPCVFGGSPNCSECGCSISMGMHWLGNLTVAGPLRAKHLINGSLSVGRAFNRLRGRNENIRSAESRSDYDDLIQIEQ
ncbi:MAG: radical SAM protein [Acidobacteriaceae bacterium]|nr:radical SAM protein [Acidobacteriaceae bacterium]MBV9500814.1 radical SAM protein [Acidobacteriaceae bacterium]